jgi:membrane associated rhomboid family serine protease
MAASYRRWGGTGGGGPVMRGGGSGGYHVLGRFVPKPIAWLIAATVFMTAVGSLLHRNGISLLAHVVLDPGLVLQGEVWRLVPWILVERDVLGLIFGCLFLFFLGPDLLRVWGTRRFLTLYFGGAAVVGALTCLVGLQSFEVRNMVHVGMWPMIEAFIIAWATLFPDRQILMYFVLPIGGRHLITLTLAGTLLFAMVGGFPQFVPHFIAEALALVYMDVFSFRRLYLQGRMAMLQRDYKKRTAHLKMVEREDEKPPRWMH